MNKKIPGLLFSPRFTFLYIVLTGCCSVLLGVGEAGSSTLPFLSGLRCVLKILTALLWVLAVGGIFYNIANRGWKENLFFMIYLCGMTILLLLLLLIFWGGKGK